MGSLSGDELSLLGSIQSSIPMEICDSTRKAKKIVNVKKLEEEMMKIHGFKLQIPLCLEILNHAISYMKEEENEKCSEIDTQPLLQDFISLNKTIEEEEEEDLLREELLKEKEFQLWRDNDHVSNIRFSDTKIKNKVENVRNDEKKRSNGLSMLLSPKVETGLGLGLTSSSTVNVKSKGDIVRCGYTSNTMPQPPQFLQQQALRKPRRCWTPELHRRFVDALKQLGGPGVATPKQIREHMQEEGLSNDEVKSHLQKYRLHMRKPSSKPEKQSVVVLGLNLWISSEQEQETCQGGEGESTKRRSDSRFGSPQGPLQLPCTTTTTCGDSNSIGSC